MFIFILESLGTSELILIGIIALMFLGPRKLPGMARKAGKMMAEFRGTASEFKETWQREVNFEEEAKLLNIKELDDEASGETRVSVKPERAEMTAPAVKEVDASRFTDLIDAGKPAIPAHVPETKLHDDIGNDKKNWL